MQYYFPVESRLNLARPTKTAMLRRLAAGGVLLYLLLINKVLSLSVVVTSGDDVFTK